MVEFTHSLTPVLPALLSRVRALFDLDARPDLIAQHLRKDARLAAAVKANPGLRVPGAFNGFELGVRAILGQQVTVKAATTIACRFVEAFGEPIVTPFAGADIASRPAPARVAAASVDDIARHGIVAARCQEHHRAGAGARLRRAVASTAARITNPDDAIRRLTELPGIGQWTAHYIAMRALRWPDAFPKEDIAVRNNLGGVTAKEAEACRRPGGRGAATRSCTSGAWPPRRRRRWPDTHPANTRPQSTANPSRTQEVSTNPATTADADAAKQPDATPLTTPVHHRVGGSGAAGNPVPGLRAALAPLDNDCGRCTLVKKLLRETLRARTAG